MRASGLWPDLASLGLGALAVALGAWYWVDSNWLESETRYQAVKRAMEKDSEPGLNPAQPVGPPAFNHILTDLTSPQTREAEEPTGAEEILAASPGPVADRLFGAGANLVWGTGQATSGHRWIQFAATACVLLFLTCLALVLGLPLLLIMAFGYVSDSRHDIRLRIIVGLLLVDIALQVIANV